MFGGAALLAFAVAGCAQLLSDWSIGSDAEAPYDGNASLVSEGGSGGSGESEAGDAPTSGDSGMEASAPDAFPDVGFSEASSPSEASTPIEASEALCCQVPSNVNGNQCDPVAPLACDGSNWTITDVTGKTQPCSDTTTGAYQYGMSCKVATESNLNCEGSLVDCP